MVVSVVDAQLAEQARADRIFHALADSTRRDILRRSMDGKLSVSALARGYPISTTAVQKHVAVLETAGLVARSRRGREQLVQSRVDGLDEARSLLDEFEQLWRERIGRIGDLLAETEESEKT